jgi:hypothetical protein
MPKTPTLKNLADEGRITRDLPLMCVVRGRTFLEDLNGKDLSSAEYEKFEAVLDKNGVIAFDGETFAYPSTASRAVRKIVEHRSDRIPEKTGGWLYWHFKDPRTNRWAQIEELRQRKVTV